jgi:hypothetical protein
MATNEISGKTSVLILVGIIISVVYISSGLLPVFGSLVSNRTIQATQRQISAVDSIVPTNTIISTSSPTLVIPTDTFVPTNTLIPTAIITATAKPILLPTQTAKPKTPTKATSQYVCNCDKTCPNLSCAEAQYQLNFCGCSKRDADHDGVACDDKCQ